jgi:predicted transcriptional regulator
MVRTQIQLTDEQAKRLRAFASERRVSVAEIIREAVEERMKRAGAPSREEIKARALAVAGMFESGTPDLVERLDDYLAEAYES